VARVVDELLLHLVELRDVRLLPIPFLLPFVVLIRIAIAIGA